MLITYRSAAGAEVTLPGKHTNIGTTETEILAAPSSIMSLIATGMIIGNKTQNPITVALVEDTGTTKTKLTIDMPIPANETRVLIFPDFIQAAAGKNMGAVASMDDAASVMIFARTEGA